MASAEAPAGTVLHYSRLGEPPNTCGSDVKITEDLWIQIPTAQPGQSFALGAPSQFTGPLPGLVG